MSNLERVGFHTFRSSPIDLHELSQRSLLQSEILALMEPGKPKQSSLRRAMSAAYYALFHMLVSEAAAVVSVKLNKVAKNKVRRSFAHADMKRVCRSYAIATTAGSFKPTLASLLVFPLQPELKNVANTFYKLQEFRHLADYDLNRP